MENMTTIIATLIILVTITVLSIRGVRLSLAEAREEEDRVREREEIAEEKALEKHLEVTRSDFLVISDRLTAQVTDHKFHWLSFTIRGETRIYSRLKDLFATEELSPQEVRDLEAIDRHLGNVRNFKGEKANKPVGYIIRNHFRYGDLIEWTPGLKFVGHRNKVGILVAQTEDGRSFIHKVYISTDLVNELQDVYEIAHTDGTLNEGEWVRFQQEYMNTEGRDADFYTPLRPEFERIEEIKEEMNKFNRHRKPLQGMEYHGSRSNLRNPWSGAPNV